MPLSHVIGLLGIERIGDAAEYKDVELYSLLSVLLVLLLLHQQLLPRQSLLAGQGRGGRPSARSVIILTLIVDIRNVLFYLILS